MVLREGQEVMREGAAMRVPGKQKALTQEEADLMFASSAQVEFDRLSPVTAEAVMNLSSCDKHLDPIHSNKKIALGIYQTNSFQLEDEVNGGLFLTISRINHSCWPKNDNAKRYLQNGLKVKLYGTYL
mmetsp:Transcript_20365/g.23345  ORF Transcript_20365/g.23345 Transcript_20365/m.23345 type:complete len:128 (+) Transcript_20365:1619-2002(+)